jgi:hypothetical protein
MKSKTLLNLAMLAALLALAGVALLEPGKEEPRAVRLTEMDENAVERIELRNKENIVFEKSDEHWRLSAPFAAPANDMRVRQLLDIAHAESVARYPLAPEDLARFELDKPKAVLNLGSVKLTFGGAEPIDMRRYVQIGDTLHLANDDFFHHLIAPAVDYVDKKLLPEDAKPSELFLPGLKVVQAENGRWRLDSPGDSAGIDDLVNAWRTARAIEVKRIEQPPQGDIVRIAMAGGANVEFVIVQREPDLLLARADRGLQYLLPGDAAKQLLTLQKPEAEDKNPEDKMEDGENEPEADAQHEMDNAVSQPPMDEEEETPAPDSGED